MRIDITIFVHELEVHDYVIKQLKFMPHYFPI